jgi:signal peptidase II
VGAVAVAIVVADQATKWLVRASIGPEAKRDVVEIVPGWLRLDYTENTGVAFGVLSGGGRWLAVPVMLAAVVLTLLFLKTTLPTRFTGIASALVLGGAAGNLIDRVRFGHVVDFVELGRWPTFNVADAAITVGTTALLAHLVIGDTLARGARRASQGPLEIGASERG